MTIEKNLRWPSGPNWSGSTVAILASGPSLTVEQVRYVQRWRTLDPVRRRAIAINTTFRLAPWADVLYGCDGAWWMTYFSEVKASFQGQLWSQDVAARIAHPEINQVGGQRSEGLSRIPGLINQGFNSGYQAINFAWQCGADRIILLGYDMQNVGGRGHWHDDHPAPLAKNGNFRLWLTQFEALARDLAKEGCDVVNCTLTSALVDFPKKPLTETLRIDVSPLHVESARENVALAP